MHDLASLRLCDSVFHPLRERRGKLILYVNVGRAGNRLAESQTRTPTPRSATSHHVRVGSNISRKAEQGYDHAQAHDGAAGCQRGQGGQTNRYSASFFASSRGGNGREQNDRWLPVKDNTTHTRTRP